MKFQGTSMNTYPKQLGENHGEFCRPLGRQVFTPLILIISSSEKVFTFCSPFVHLFFTSFSPQFSPALSRAADCMFSTRFRQPQSLPYPGGFPLSLLRCLSLSRPCLTPRVGTLKSVAFYWKEALPTNWGDSNKYITEDAKTNTDACVYMVYRTLLGLCDVKGGKNKTPSHSI